MCQDSRFVDGLKRDKLHIRMYVPRLQGFHDPSGGQKADENLRRGGYC